MRRRSRSATGGNAVPPRTGSRPLWRALFLIGRRRCPVVPERGARSLEDRFERLGSISVGHLYNLHNSVPYRAQRVVLTKTRPTKTATIGVRKAPAPDGRPGFIRIDSIHQGDLDSKMTISDTSKDQPVYVLQVRGLCIVEL